MPAPASGSSGDRLRHPEWAGYLAAFDAYLDARRHGDDEHAEQARTLMRYFVAELFDPAVCPAIDRPLPHDLGPLLAQLGLLPEEDR